MKYYYVGIDKTGTVVDGAHALDSPGENFPVCGGLIYEVWCVRTNKLLLYFAT